MSLKSISGKSGTFIECTRQGRYGQTLVTKRTFLLFETRQCKRPIDTTFKNEEYISSCPKILTSVSHILTLPFILKMASSKLIVVLGATGGQGNSVVEAFLTEKDYTIRGVTRQPQSEKAQALSKKGVEVVKADIDDQASLVKAFEGASVIFAMTDFFEPFTKHGPNKAIEIEQKQGENIARAASKTTSLQHFLWSTLPDGNTLTKGKFVIPHFEGKNRIDRFIQNDKALLAKTTFFWVGFYAENLFYPIFTPIYVVRTLHYLASRLLHSINLYRRKAHRSSSNCLRRTLRLQSGPLVITELTSGSSPVPL